MIPNADVIEIFNFLSKNAIVTKPADIPTASREVYDKLLAVGVPKALFSPIFPRKCPREQASVKIQHGGGKKVLYKNWLLW